MLTNSFTMLERREHASTSSESQLSHHAHVLVTCSKIYERLLHCGVREKRREDQRKREGERGGMQILTNSELQLNDTSCLYKVPVVKCTRDNRKVKIGRRVHAYQLLRVIDHVLVILWYL